MDNNEHSIGQYSELEERMHSFHGRLKKHLSDEYLILSEKKDSLENEITQIKVEIEQRDRTLFPNVEKGDVRKYFSPLNISDHEEKHKDEKERELYNKMESVEKDISLLETRMKEIMDFFRDIDDMLEYYKKHGKENDTLLDEEENNESEHDIDFDEENKDLPEDEDLSEDGATLKDEELSEEEASDNDVSGSGKHSGSEENHKMKIYPQMIRNLYNIIDYFKEKYKDFDILIEFNDNNIEIDPDIQRDVLNQIFSNINIACKEKAVNMALIEGSVKDNKIFVKISYAYEDHSIDNINIIYDLQLS